MTNDEKLLISRANDVFRLCTKYAEPRFTSFLDGAEQECIKDNIYCGENTMFFGGFDDSERKIFGVFPDWSEPEYDEFPIDVVKIEHTFGSELSHRDYLGSLMSLGIERSTTGDILIDNNTAYIFVLREISGYIKNNLSKIGNKGVNVTVCGLSEVVLPERKFRIYSVVAASMRADAVVAAAAKLSRSKAAAMIDGGYVKVNHKELTKASYELSKGDLISIRGFGRVILEDVPGNTRSGRLHITLKQYI